MHLCDCKVFALAVAIVSLFIAHYSISALPVNRSKHDSMPEVEVMHQDNKNGVQEVKAAVGDPPHEGGGLKVIKEEQIGNPVNDEHKHGKNEEVNLDAEMAKKLGKLSVDKLKPVDHIDGVKMEQDGHINDQYHKEMFLGEAHDEFKNEHFEEAEEKLKEIAELADADKDGFLSKAEMEKWILRNMEKHFSEAEIENEHIFKHLDPDGDGFVKWKEYYVHFLLSRGIEVEQAIEYVKDYDNSIEMKLEDKDSLMTYKFKWTEADTEPADNQLSKAEFMVFRHPEHSKISLQRMVENVLNSVDINSDGMVSMEEFAALPPGEVEGKEFEDMDRKWQEERRREFREIMDINHDGQVTGKELERYLDPTNPVQAKIETDSLVDLMDDNKDGQLSIAEILDHREIFGASKLANFANVHDEF